MLRMLRDVWGAAGSAVGSAVAAHRDSLLAAAALGPEELRRGRQEESRGKDELDSALHAAASAVETRAVHQLLDTGGDVNVKAGDMSTNVLVKLLMGRGADVMDPPLLLVLQLGNDVVVKILVTSGADVARPRPQSLAPPRS
jgi:hypothetical protein